MALAAASLWGLQPGVGLRFFLCVPQRGCGVGLALLLCGADLGVHPALDLCKAT